MLAHKLMMKKEVSVLTFAGTTNFSLGVLGNHPYGGLPVISTLYYSTVNCTLFKAL